MKKSIIITVTLALAALCLVCGGEEENNDEEEAEYVKITAEEARKIMDSQTGYVIVDVRSEAEYKRGHIPGAILLPSTDIASLAAETLTDKDQLILVYCRSGSRSKKAADILIEQGYTNVNDFGGINDWPYETEK